MITNDELRESEPEKQTVTISREAAIKALVDSDTVEALEAEIKAKDQAIGDFRRLLNDLRIEIAYKFGENTVLNRSKGNCTFRVASFSRNHR